MSSSKEAGETTGASLRGDNKRREGHMYQNISKPEGVSGAGLKTKHGGNPETDGAAPNKTVSR